MSLARAVGMLAVAGFLERRPGETDQAVALGQRVDTAFHGGPLVPIGKELGVFIRVGPIAPLQAVHDPGHVAYAGNDFGLGKQVKKQGHLATPTAVGIKDGLLVRLRRVVGGKHAAQQIAPLGL